MLATVAKVVDDFETAASNKDTATICNRLLAPDVAKRLAAVGRSCRTVIGTQLDDVDVFNVTVAAVGVRGDTANVKVRSTFDGANRLNTLVLKRAASGRWQIESMQ